MSEPRDFDPDWVVATSHLLREEMQAMGITSTTVMCSAVPLTRRHEVVATLDAVLNEDGPMTEDLAVALMRITGVSTGFWLRFEHNYRVGKAAGKTVVQ